MKPLKEYLVPWPLSASTYDVSILDHAWANPEYARLMGNENPIPPSETVVHAVAEAVRQGNRYPDSMARLRARIGARYGMTAENIRLANGSSELIDAMARIFLQPGDEIILSKPTYGLYRSRAEMCGARVVSVLLRKQDLQYDVKGMQAAVTDRTKVVVVVNPNSNTGMFIDEKDLLDLCELGIPLCIDEAYRDYHPERKSKAYLIRDFPHVFIHSTFSKAYGFAGLRLGYVVGARELVQAFNRILLPWNVSVMAMAAADAILDHPEEVRAKIEYNNRWMHRFHEELKALGLKPFPPHGNYMLVDATHTGKTTEEIILAALDRKIYLRAIEPLFGRTGYFRVTLGTDPENKRFLEFVEEFFCCDESRRHQPRPSILL